MTNPIAAAFSKALTPNPYPPPRLTWPGRISRYVAAVLIGLVAGGVTITATEEGMTTGKIEGVLLESSDAVFAVDMVCGVALFVLMALRRKRPVLVLVLTAILAPFSSLGIGAFAIVFVSVATRRKWMELLAGYILYVLSTVATAFIIPLTYSSVAQAVLTATVAVVVVYSVGFAIGSQREAQAATAERLQYLESSRSAQVHQARVSERAEIAREMHDVLAHRISLVALHSGALAYREDIPADQVRETAQLIRTNAHEALKELREVLGVLRDPGAVLSQDNTDPLPTLGSLDTLLDNVRAAGLAVTCERVNVSELEIEGLLKSLSRNAYRVIQESLTNARKHAPDASAQVVIAKDAGKRLRITVTNDVSSNPGRKAPESGFGLIGMAERVRSSEGTFYSGVRNSQFVVEASFPWLTAEGNS